MLIFSRTNGDELCNYISTCLSDHESLVELEVDELDSTLVACLGMKLDRPPTPEVTEATFELDN